jgi:hypothetical protein
LKAAAPEDLIALWLNVILNKNEYTLMEFSDEDIRLAISERKEALTAWRAFHQEKTFNSRN